IAGVKLASFNLDNQIVTAATPTQFTIHNASIPDTKRVATPGTATGGRDGVSEHAYYNLAKGSSGYDQYELKNVFKSLAPATKAALHAAVVENTTCGQTGMPTCWQAQQ